MRKVDALLTHSALVKCVCQSCLPHFQTVHNHFRYASTDTRPRLGLNLAETTAETEKAKASYPSLVTTLETESGGGKRMSRSSTGIISVLAVRQGVI